MSVVDIQAIRSFEPASPFSKTLASWVDGGPFAVVLVPESAWSTALDRVAVDLAGLVSREGGDGDELWLHAQSFGSVLGGSSAGSEPRWNHAVVWGVGVAVATVCLLVLTLSLVLVRLESQDEENVFRTQGAGRGVLARVCGRRATLATVAAAVPAVSLSLIFVGSAGGSSCRTRSRSRCCCCSAYQWSPGLSSEQAASVDCGPSAYRTVGKLGDLSGCCRMPNLVD